MAAAIGNFQIELENALKTAKPKLDIPKEINKKSEKDILKTLNDNFRLKDIEWITVYFENCHKLNSKSAEKADCLRKDGNKLFQRKLYKEAVDKYTQAIINGPLESKELGFAYGNRSAALYHMGLYNDCLDDLYEAYECEFPGCIVKLFRRETQCKKHLGLIQGTSADDLVRSVSQLQLGSKEKEDEFCKGVRMIAEKNTNQTMISVYCANSVAFSQGVTMMQEAMADNLKRGLTADGEPLVSEAVVNVSVDPEVSYGKNGILVQASSAVNLENNAAKGRYLTASRDIQLGDTLIVERPYAAVLLPDHYPTHCHHCFQKLQITYPCRQCTMVRYCSTKCAKGSWDMYHSVECRYLQLLHSVGIAHLGLRIVLTAGAFYLLDFMEEEVKLGSQQKIPGLDEHGQYHRNYRSVYDLMTHVDDMDTDDIFQYSMTASLLLEILRHAGWFTPVHSLLQQSKYSSTDYVAEDTESCIGGLLLRHILQLVCNAHAITELQCTQTGDTDKVEEMSQVRIATAIYPTASLMNHSCDPSIISSFCKDKLVVKAVKDIKEGSEIFNCYGPHFKRMTWSERQLSLKQQYFFTCQCKPCLEGEASEARFLSFRCQNCDGPISRISTKTGACEECGVVGKVDIAKVSHGDQLFTEALQLLKERKINDAVSMLKQCYKVRKSVLYKYNKHLSEVQDCLGRCYAMLDDYTTSAKYVQESIQIVSHMYGENSIEMANELHKLSEILIGAHNWKDALTANEKACYIFEKNYGKSSDFVKELESKRKELLQVINCPKT